MNSKISAGRSRFPGPLLSAWTKPSLLALVALIFWQNLGLSGEFNRVLSITDPAPRWERLQGTDGQLHSLSDLKAQKIVVIVFTCNSCPYAVDVQQRLVEFESRFADRGVALVAINANKVEQDQLPAMKERAREQGFKFPYLWDESQQTAKAFGARNTPEFFVLDAERKVVYMGAFDDSPTGDKITKHYVVDAVESLLDDRDIKIEETVPIGCLIRYERDRRRRSRTGSEKTN